MSWLFSLYMHGLNRWVVVLISALFFLPATVISASNTINTGVTDNGIQLVLIEQLSDGTIITVNQAGEISKQTVSSGKLVPLWVFETNITTTTASIDNGFEMLAIITNSGYFTFNLNTIEIDYFNNISNEQTPTYIDWDSEGDIWVAYGTGLKKAIEYRGQVKTGNETETVSMGFLQFKVLNDDSIAFGGVDKKVHIFNQGGNLVRLLTEPSSFITLISQDLENNLIVGTASGELYLYDSTWQVSDLDLSIEENLIHFQESENGLNYLIGTNSGTLFVVEKATLSAQQNYLISGAVIQLINEPEGRLSIVSNSDGFYEVYFFDVDSDGDGVSDSEDEYPSDQSQYIDSDGDGYGDNITGSNGDKFPYDSTQFLDSDDDGYGDNPAGNNSDLFPLNPDQWVDSDGDGYGDNSNGLFGDQFPNDSTQWNDSDGDGYGDNISGNNSDSCPGQSGYSTIDRYGCIDSDTDGYSDPDSNFSIADGADALPDDDTQWSDGDLDGYGDNPAPANKPDSCPLNFGNSTKQQFRDGTNMAKFGCIDSDGDGFEDNSDDFPNDRLEWFDYDLDGIGSNSDYDDTTSQIKTIKDYCIVSGDNSTTCKSYTDLDYQEYLNRQKGPDETDLSYSAWLLNEQHSNLEQEDETLTSTIKEVSIVGGSIFAVACVIILLVSFVVKRRKVSKFVKRYGVPYDSKQVTASQEALEGSAGSSAVGGIESNEGWDDEIVEMDFTKVDEEITETPQTMMDAEELYDPEVQITDIAGMEVPTDDIPSEQVNSVLNEDTEAPVEEKPANTPPLPASGLPEGWTMEQWEWYGHEWLSRFGNQ